MARQGVFNRNDNSLTPINRSLQMLEHRHVMDARYGEIMPIFYAQMYPNESLRLNVTNFLRTIPMKTPQLTRVKIITRFIAVPNRLMWLGFEEYIDGVKDSQFNMTEPYIANFNAIKTTTISASASNFKPWNMMENASHELYFSRAGYQQQVLTNIANIKDYSTLGLGVTADKAPASPGTFWSFSSSRALYRSGVLDNPMFDGTKTELTGYQFFPHELGDMFNCPIYTPSLASDVSGRITAYPFAAYQLAYSYFYRNPNVQERIDDVYQMAMPYPDQRTSEFTSYYGLYNARTAKSGVPGSIVPPVSAMLDNTDDSYDGYSINPTAVVVDDQTNPEDGQEISYPLRMTDWASITDNSELIWRSSWKNIEHFPLKAGPNIFAQAMTWRETGVPVFCDSSISLTRTRFANWQSDRFTTANPWQQRGDEAQIPVVGTVQFDGLTISASGTPEGTVTSTFTGTEVSFRHNHGLDTGDAANASLEDGEIQAVYMNTDNQERTAWLSESSIEDGDYAAPAVDDGTFSRFLNVKVGSDLVNISGYTQPADVFLTPSGTVTSAFTGSPMTFSGTVQAGGIVSGLYVSPSSFRFAMQLQKIKEMSARTDGRFKSFLSMFYGARSRDARLDRPEFIGGTVQELNITEIAQTSESTDTSSLGTLAGRGISGKKSSQIAYHASEHTAIIGLVHIIPDSIYIGGLDRTMHLTDPFDWAMPQFAGLSEQPIRMAELAFQPTKFNEVSNSDNEVTFGFEPRYNELRAKHSYATGAFRDVMNSTGSREYYAPWLITRNFGIQPSIKWQQNTSPWVDSSNTVLLGVEYTVPSLSDEFLSMRHTVDNENFEVTDENVMYPFMLDSYFNVRWTRIVPTRGIPKI